MVMYPSPSLDFKNVKNIENMWLDMRTSRKGASAELYQQEKVVFHPFLPAIASNHRHIVASATSKRVSNNKQVSQSIHNH